jgi:hypothetical protein
MILKHCLEMLGHSLTKFRAPVYYFSGRLPGTARPDSGRFPAKIFRRVYGPKTGTVTKKTHFHLAGIEETDVAHPSTNQRVYIHKPCSRVGLLKYHSLPFGGVQNSGRRFSNYLLMYNDTKWAPPAVSNQIWFGDEENGFLKAPVNRRYDSMVTFLTNHVVQSKCC